MRKYLLYPKAFLSLFIVVTVLFFPLYSYSENLEESEDLYAQVIEELADKIVASHMLFKEGESFYKENETAQKFLELCQKKIKPVLKEKKTEPKKEKEDIFGFFSIKQKDLKTILSKIPARDIPKKRLTLDECVKIGMENSLPIKIAEKQTKLARIRLWEARRKLAPSVKARWEESSGRIYGKDYDGRKVHIEGSQPIFHGGELVFIASQARINLEIVENDYDRVKNGLILKVEKAYYSLDKAIKFLEVQRVLHEKAKRLNDFIDRGYQLGAISKI